MASVKPIRTPSFGEDSVDGEGQWTHLRPVEIPSGKGDFTNSKGDVCNLCIELRKLECILLFSPQAETLSLTPTEWALTEQPSNSNNAKAIAETLYCGYPEPNGIRCTYTSQVVKDMQELRASVLKIIIHSSLASILLLDRFLLAVHLRHGPRGRCLLGLLIVSGLYEPGEAKRYTLSSPSRPHELIRRRLVTGTECQIRSFHLPHQPRFEPYIGLVFGHVGMGVEGLGPINRQRGECIVELFQDRFRESRADVADRLICLRT